MESLKLRQMMPKREKLIRTFWYPESSTTDETNGFRVTCAYVNSAELVEIQQQATTRIKQSGRILEDMPGATQRSAVLHEVLTMAILKIEGMTYGKLRRYVPIEAEKVRELGGPDKLVDMDSERTPEGKDNVLFLVEQNQTFANWLAQVTSDISRFQDADWETRAKNSESGAESTSG